VPYAKRLAQDEYVQEHLRNATEGLREAYGRARSKGRRTTEDKKFYANLGEAASSISKAANRLRRKPEPKRRGRKVAAAAVAGGAGLLLIRRRKAKSDVPHDFGDGPLSDPAADSHETVGSEAVADQPQAESGGTA